MTDGMSVAFFSCLKTAVDARSVCIRLDVSIYSPHRAERYCFRVLIHYALSRTDPLLLPPRHS